MMKISKQLMQQIQQHAQRVYPKEACGLIIKTDSGRVYHPCQNLAATPNENFIINPRDYCVAENKGEVIAIVHSHPNASPTPSMADKVMCEALELPWLIVSEPDMGHEWLLPSQYQAPLLGRQFSHGVLDCWTLCRDFYFRELGIELMDFKRSDLWWEDKQEVSLYEANYQQAGFYPVELKDIQRGDMIIMQIGRSYHPNHAGIYLGNDGSLTSEEVPAVIGSSLFLHHMHGKNSTRDIYGGSWQERTRLLLRYRG